MAFGTYTHEIYVMNSDGSGLTELTDKQVDRFPAWSPDGKNIAFQRAAVGWTGQIYVMNADGTNPKRLTGKGRNFVPNWQPVLP